MGIPRNDTCLLYRGMKQDSINDSDTTAGNVDTIKVAADIVLDDIIVKQERSDLYLSIKGTTDWMKIYSYTEPGSQIERVEFADDTVWSPADLKRLSKVVASEGADMLYGDDASEQIDGLGGNDQIYGSCWQRCASGRRRL